MSIIYTLLAALALSALVTPVVRRFARKRGVLARPTQDRWHRAPVALLGGYAIAISFLFVVGLRGTVAVTWPLLVGPGLMFALGALDDVFRLRPATKLVAQMTIAAIMIAIAPAVHITGTLIVDSLLTFTWIVGITNAFNLLDNIDGLSAGTAAIAGLFYLAVLAPAGASPLAHVVAAPVGGPRGVVLLKIKPAAILKGENRSQLHGGVI
jgi:UDP-GlcNAc:undecaprenyl-phosphate GlcNAc-1-phosphate transferase